MTQTQQAQKNTEYDLVIVGAGVVGASFAALLHQAVNEKKHSQEKPLRIALVDGGDAPSLPPLEQATFDPRVVALTAASKSLLVSLGLWEKISQQRACAYTKMYVWDNDGTANINFSATEIQQPELGNIVENSILQCAVLERIEQQENITLLRGVQVESIEQEEAGTRILCGDGRILTASLLVAADGAKSKLRALSGIQVRQWEYQHKAIVTTVKSSQSHQHTAWQNFLPTGPLAFLPLEHPSENYCSIVWSVETEKADQLMALDDDGFAIALGKAFEHRLGNIESVAQRFSFPLVQRHAVDYSENSIVLIGDAAHTIHPLAGQGMNLGLLDAHALVTELTRAKARGLAINDRSVLRRYQRKRKGHNMEVMLLMEGFKRLFGSRNALVRWLRNAGMKKVNEWYLLKNWLAKQAIKEEVK